MEADITNYVKSCEQCQLRDIRRSTDSVPIEPLARPQYPFQVVNIDVISIDPASSKGHKYILVLVDYATRWIEAIPTKTLTAKESINALIKIFTEQGIPETICSDNGTNFAAALTNAFYEILGIKPRYSTPEHPASNGLVERANRTFKNMLHHTIQKYGRKWDQMVPLITWAMRDMPNDTTGIPPVTLKTGQPPRGPLHILKLNMLKDEATIPLTLGKKDSDFLKELKENLRSAAQLATQNFDKNAKRYADNYNKKAEPKAFEVGDEVIVFKTGINLKMSNRWEGPATITNKVRNHSYNVQFENRRTQVVHADRLRPFIRRCSAIAMVQDPSDEFGEIIHTPLITKINTTLGVDPKEADNQSDQYTATPN